METFILASNLTKKETVLVVAFQQDQNTILFVQLNLVQDVAHPCKHVHVFI